MAALDRYIEQAPDPAQADLRLGRMREDRRLCSELERLDADRLCRVVALVSFSGVLFHFLCRHPQAVGSMLDGAVDDVASAPAADFDALRYRKYLALCRIAVRDLGADDDYRPVLQSLTMLAERTLHECWRLVLDDTGRRRLDRALCTIALGKFGAAELNFSSDLDLVFVSDNHGNHDDGIEAFQQQWFDAVRSLSRELERQTDGGFLYRVDLNLRPWGRSGPLFMALDDTEHYYEASSDAWERFAWLRARPVAGAGPIGAELLERLRPFIYLRSLSSSDLERFVAIKSEMAAARRRAGHWNVKTGAGGIRDIEFFVQTLQIVNAARHPALQTTGTLHALAGLAGAGLIDADEAQRIGGAYLWLRRLENHLQMVDEQQTHELPDDRVRRLIVARSMLPPGTATDDALDNFETRLLNVRALARTCFERILPGGGGE